MSWTPEDATGEDAAEVAGSTTTEIQTLALLEEVLKVSKREVETGRVRVSVLTDTEQRLVRDTLRTRRIDVRRVPLGTRLPPGEAMPQTRMDGDELVVPVIEEVLVVEKRLVVTEELRIRIVHSQEEVERTVPVRRQRAVVEPMQPANDDMPGAAP